MVKTPLSHSGDSRFDPARAHFWSSYLNLMVKHFITINFVGDLLNKIYLLAILLPILLFGCAGQSSTQTNISSTTQVMSNTSNTNLNPVVTNPVVEINMTAKQWEFIPNTITVQKGTLVRLFITAEDVEHGFWIKDLNVNAKLPVGQTTKVEFIANKAGTFTFQCSVMCGEGHRDQKGTLIVQ